MCLARELLYEALKGWIDGIIKQSVLSPGGKTMNRPLEYEEMVRVNGFSILDNDFDLMTGDLCCGVEGEPNIHKICASVARVIKVVFALWQDPAGFNPDGAVSRMKAETVDTSSAWLN
jgi:hypothetical protein